MYMSSNRYRKTELCRRIWLTLAVFFLIFNSTPVKKFIRLHLSPQQFRIETTNQAEQLSSSYVKDCTLIERHTGAQEISSIVQMAGVSTDALLVLSVISSVSLLLAAYYQKTSRPQYGPLLQPVPATPAYIRHRRIQV